MHVLQRSNDPRFAAYSLRARDFVGHASRNPSGAILLVDADLSVAAHSEGMKEPLECYSLAFDKAGLSQFIAVSGLRDHILDVFASGRGHELVVSAPGGRRHWRAVLTGSEEVKPKQVLVTLEPCSSLLQFESGTGHITCLDADECKRLGWPEDVESRDFWNVRALTQIDWQELLIKQLERPGCQVVEVRAESSTLHYCDVRISMVDSSG